MATVEHNFRSGRHVVSDLHAHIESATEVCAKWGVTMDAADGTDDHLHLLISYPPNVVLSKLVGAVKTATSKRVRSQRWPEVTNALWGKHFWSPSSCVVSSGGVLLEVVQRYVERQQGAVEGSG